MARMLHVTTSGVYAHCDFCDRKNKGRKASRRERKLARTREKRKWKGGDPDL